MSSARNHQIRSHRSYKKSFGAMNGMARRAYYRGGNLKGNPSFMQRIGNVFKRQKALAANRKQEVHSNDGN